MIAVRSAGSRLEAAAALCANHIWKLQLLQLLRYLIKIFFDRSRTVE